MQRSYSSSCSSHIVRGLSRSVARNVQSKGLPSAFLTTRRSYHTSSSYNHKSNLVTPFSLSSSNNVSLRLNPRLTNVFARSFSTDSDIVVKVPSMGDSISEGTIAEVLKKPGDSVRTDELVLSIDTDKIKIEVNAPENGVISEIFGAKDEVVKVGAPLFKYKKGGAEQKSEQKVEQKTEAKAAETPKQQPKETPAAQPTQAPPQPKVETPKPQPPKSTSSTPVVTGEREQRVTMSRMRQRIAERLKDSQNTAAMLTTFNEIDMSALMALRNQYKDEFEKKHGVKLGFMSAFVKAAVAALKDQKVVNAMIDGKDIVYRDFYDIGVAVASPKGLVVPILRDCDKLSFAGVEKALGGLAEKAKADQITLEDMAGGTFTISNGGVFGSMFGTPIINPPQSAILGMHAVKDRPVAVNGQVVIRPIMYVALTYDHRLIDGREAVTFLKKIKEAVEDPRKLLLEL
eukprot:TRINITY_DN3895_c0_g1_i2.p1 TRINITY_DN3895_c0_g1~~TRINITY_DN3895_c0_g1_i2.p1  ORF type:complete len:458 (+),score=128.45 TRINITY_DN3895_c0_g1_i2:140-1513(+)